MNLAEAIVAALNGPVPAVCPLTNRTPEGADTKVLPDAAKKLLPLSEKLRDVAATAMKEGPKGDDAGVWFRHQLETDAMRVIISNIIRSERKLSYRYSFEFFADWKYTDSGS